MRHSNKPSSFSRQESGFSLIEVLIVSSIMIVVSMGIITLIMSQQKELKRQVQKLSLMDINVSLKNLLQDPLRCGFNFLQPSTTLDTTLIPASGSLSNNLITVPEVRNGVTATSPLLFRQGLEISVAQGVTVSNIAFSNWRRASISDTYYADLVVAVVSDSGPMAPVSISGITFITDPASPASAKVPTLCGTSVSSTPTQFQGTLNTVGTFTTTYTGTNSETYPVQINVTGGKTPVSGQNANSCFLSGPGSHQADNDRSYSKSCFITFWVAPGASYTITSNPYPLGNGQFNVYQFR